MNATRRRSLKALKGFVVAPNLPVGGARGSVEGKLRPPRDIAQRLMALDAVFTWTVEEESGASSERVRAYSARNDLPEAMTSGERAIFESPRATAREAHQSTVGWRLENMWPLAWVLGFEEEPTIGGMIGEATIRRILLEFLPGLDRTVDDLLARVEVRAEAKVIRVEDLFYCAHNAARSAQTGGRTVPAGFHPVVDGGVVHERRHALTWCLSPGIAWDATDLNT